jgi:hypothetical protein
MTPGEINAELASFCAGQVANSQQQRRPGRRICNVKSFLGECTQFGAVTGFQIGLDRSSRLGELT